MDHRNILQTGIGHLAAIGLKRMNRGPLGILVSPVTWAYNFNVQGSVPTSVDAAFWAIALPGGILASAALAASYVKALVDDDVERKLEEVRRGERPSRRPGILALAGWGPPSSLAGHFARKGGTAWQHSNGLWVSIVDAREKMIVDYTPAHPISIRRPVWPLQRAPGGLLVSDKLPRLARRR